MFYTIKNIRRVYIDEDVEEQDMTNMIGYVVKVQDEALHLGYPAEILCVHDQNGNICDGKIKLPSVYGISHKGDKLKGVMSGSYVFDLEWYKKG